MALNLNDLKTAIIPVSKKDDQYTIKIASSLWNSLQILILKGAKQENLVIEFQIEEEK